MKPTLKLLMVALTLSALLLSLPASADGWQDKLGGVVVGEPNDGPFLGGGISYPVGPFWGDLFARTETGGTDLCAGLSTSLQPLATMIGTLLSLDIGNLPDGVAGGGGSPFDRWEPFMYFAWHYQF